MQFLLFLTIFLTVNADLLNEFSADIDYYDMGIMGRGKNAASWHHSYENQHDIFYYLAMQPWRHIVWTKKEGNEYYKYIINEDASKVPDGSTKLPRTKEQDFCRKEYAHEIRKFEIDWSRVPKEEAAIEAVDINGQTCYQYPGKLPLAYVYLNQRHINAPKNENFQVCRMEFIGGRSITFRSFNKFSEVFITDDRVNGYNGNLTRCNIDPSPNNLDSDLSIVMGISDTSVVRGVLDGLKQLGNLATIKAVTLYSLKGGSYQKLELSVKDLLEGTKYTTMDVRAGSIDALINVAKNDMVAAMKAIEGRRKGTIVVLMDRTLSSTFDAETAFDRNNITVHVVAFNSKNDATFRHRATTLLSLGEHYHEFTTSSGLSTAMTNLFKGIRVNLTERCDRRTCNGFCDGRDRCTCPMCCENDCFYTYCDVDTASCTPWPKAEPKKKIECAQDCVGKRECKDLVGCVITEYNEGCAPKAKCQRAYCNATSGYKCAFEDTCGKDTTPSSDGFCYSYQCDTETGMCKKKNKGTVSCNGLEKTNCQEYYCTESLECRVRDKVCVKTSPYIEMACYVAKCNERTGQCENKLSCDNWVGCGESKGAACRCDSSNGFVCTCLDDDKIEGYCKSNEVCDMRGDTPTCVISECNQDLRRDSSKCQQQQCDKKTKDLYWEPTINCEETIIFEFKETDDYTDLYPEYQEEVKAKCMSLYTTTCGGNDDCKVVDKDVDPNVLCGKCVVEETISFEGTKEKVTYHIKYEEKCSDSKLCTYADGTPIAGKCNPKTKQCYYPLEEGTDVNELCINCIAHDLDCSGDLNYRNYYYYENTGDCELIQTEAKGCNACNKGSGYFESNCVGDFTKTHITSEVTTAINEKTMTYRIPKVCMYGSQCVPQRKVNCEPTKDDGSGIYQIWQLYKGCNGNGHEGAATGKYHYSEKFDETLYATGKPQSAEFVEEAEREAYCEWTLNTTYACLTCDPDLGEKSFSWVDNCPSVKDGIHYECNYVEGKYKCEFDTDVDCPPRGCNFYDLDEGLCVKRGEDMCTSKRVERKEKLDKYKEKVIERFQQDICVEEAQCKNECPDDKCKPSMTPEQMENNPFAQSSCDYETSDNHCIEIVKNYEKGVLDFGCYKPVAECDDNTYRCKYAKIVNVEDDVDYFLRKSNVVLNNKCYGYECVEEFVDGKWTHSWKLKDEFIAKQNPEARHKCETAECDPTTGEPKYTEITCNVEEQFPTISGNQSECFYCQCSYTDGSFVLSMFADTDEKTYSLDACGSCIVTDRESGKVLNEVPPCVLKQELNLTGAIAGATVAASVVFALVGAMAVVSIGLFQTYQLVTSALKNAITTTVENAEFVAADNEATNVLNAGDD